MPGQPFAWRRGLRLEATEETHLAVPGELVRQNEQLGSIVEISDNDAEVRFQQREGGGIEAIHLFLKPGQSVVLHRASEVFVVADDSRKRVFYVLSETA